MVARPVAVLDSEAPPPGGYKRSSGAMPVLVEVAVITTRSPALPVNWNRSVSEARLKGAGEGLGRQDRRRRRRRWERLTAPGILARESWA